jgi:NhaC family Na+:H+ antiporter
MKSEAKRIGFLKSFLVICFMIASLSYTILIVEGSIHVPIILTAAVAAVVAILHGHKWEDLEKGIVETISMTMPAILIMLAIGMIVGVWITAGIVPTMIYYGLKIISPGFFLVACCLLCAIVSLATGSSWTTAATVGIALIGVAEGLGIPLPMAAGAVISGSYFGDKISPISDTTNLAPAMAGAKLFDHIKHMVYTTGPSMVITLVLFGILGMRFSGKTIDTSPIDQMLNGLSGAFNLNILLLIVPVLVIFLVVKKVPALPGLFSGVILGGIAAMVFQGVTLSALFNASYGGYVSETGIEFVDNLLTRGGITSMYSTIGLILCAMIMGGVMDRSGMLEEVTLAILSKAKSTGSIVLATVLSCIATNILAGDQYLSIVVPGRMYKPIFDAKGLHPKNLSRCLEDAGTLTSPLIPWNTCGAYMYASLGVHPFAYIFYCYLNLINPVISIIYGYTGFTMEKIAIQSENDKNIEASA